MHIVRLECENLLKLRCVAIDAKGKNIIQITGENGSGKSSCLAAIAMAIEGASASPSRPVRDGEQSARVKLDLGEIIVTRKFTSDGKTSLVVEAANGSRFNSPQKLLDGLFSHLSFDPSCFIRMSPKEQLEELKKLVKLDIDIPSLEGANSRDYEKRTEIGREIKRLEGQIAGLIVPDIPSSTPIPDEVALLKKLTEASSHNTKVGQAKMERQNFERKILEAQTQMEELRKKADQLESWIEARRKEMTAQPPLPELIDVNVLSQEVAQAKKIGETLRLRDQKAQLIKQHSLLQSESDALTHAMTERLKQKEEAIARAEMPVKGLGFGEGEVTFKGVPFAQCSSAEQLVISTVLACHANPKLKIIRIQDGSLLDDHNLELIAKIAERSNMQVWIERVQSNDPAAIVLEDGSVVEKPKVEEGTKA
jgi:DNA repair exonuclease SbcCD ATPase subunit